MKPDFLIVDNHNFIDYPFGGPLTFARNLMKVFGNCVGLVGTTNDKKDPIGKWFQKDIDGTCYYFFASRLSQRSEKKPLLPNKITDFIALKRHMLKIRSLGVRRIFVQTPDAMLAVAPYDWNSICFRFTGVFNPVQFSKYSWAKPLSGVYEQRVFKAVNQADCILATADDVAIEELVGRSRGLLVRERLYKFPTRVNLEPFQQYGKGHARAELGLPPEGPVFLYCARISWTKGWDLIVEAFRGVVEKHGDAVLLMVGGGEDVPKVQEMIAEYGLAGNVQIYGRQSREEVVRFYMASDVFCVGSYIEGWSNSMLEALAASCAIVTTEVSGAHDLVDVGENGFVCTERDASLFGEYLNSALELPRAGEISRTKANIYDAANLRRDLGAVW
jgi:glycosyltransferase involved in cell wall biosynthesis